MYKHLHTSLSRSLKAWRPLHQDEYNCLIKGEDKTTRD